MTIDQLYEMRKDGLQALIDNKWIDGFKRLLTQMYPDTAHFIYELLQNAEDADASEVQFTLNADRLEFEHNGERLFKIEDVESITNIGSSPKADDDPSIGEFGIGFKSVFAYTDTPEIESGPFHFRIREMVVPDTKGLTAGSLGEKKTRFIFPFDNSKKSAERATAEIEKNLRELNENTLLFLSNICKIEYCLPDLTFGFLTRKQNPDDENRIEISVKQPENMVPESEYYLRFTKDVHVEDESKRKECRIAVAFGMDKPKDGRWKIKPLDGQVCIYFPAIKETSNLRFHLHAPFASTVARDSVRECSANDELRDHLAALIVESMHTIRDQGMLDVQFLASLPNKTDDLSEFYTPIRERLVTEFNNEKLTPMKRRLSEHAAASGCYRGPRALSDLINDKDLAMLLEKDQSQPLWIANPQQNNQREDNFLSMLGISQWTIEDLVKVLDSQPDRVAEWLAVKPEEWHQDLYELLGDFLSRAPSSPQYIARERKEKLSNLRIVRCSDGEYRIGNECHFLDDDVEPEFGKEKAQKEEFRYVAKGVYSSGQNKNQQQKSREFLEKIGVCEVDETERIKAILRQRYEDPDTGIPPKLHEEDMKRFISLVERDPDKATLFKGYNIFNTSGGSWHTSHIFLDSPYLETGLKIYYDDDKYWKYVEKENVEPYFSLDYEESDLELKKLGKFAEKLGAKTKLEVVKSDTWNHPKCDDFRIVGTGYWTDTGIDEDYYIPELHILIDDSSIAKSKLIWHTMCSAPECNLKARFCWNQSNPLQEDSSRLVYALKNAAWVPQKKDHSNFFFVKPCDASVELLPEGFPYESGQKWFKEIEFGSTASKKRWEDIHQEIEEDRQNQNANEFGFGSADEANAMAEIANALKEQGKSPEELRDKLTAGKRRKERILIELEDAPEKEYEQRLRSVRVTAGRIDRRTHLRERYTTDDNNMECQMCRQDMPFKKRNSDEDYFEAVEAFGKGYFPKEHEAQHLALCPQCAAKYKEFVKRDAAVQEVLYKLLKNADVPEVRLPLNDFAIRIWFEQKHWDDLQAIIDYYEKAEDSEESTD